MGSTTTTTTEVAGALAMKCVNALFCKCKDAHTKMEDYITSLQEERRKIESFKRELPLSILILSDVIRFLKEELMVQCRCRRKGTGTGTETVPVLEQFLPIKTKSSSSSSSSSSEEEEHKPPEKDEKKMMMKWMSSAQLWSDDSCIDDSNIEHAADRQSESGNPSLFFLSPDGNTHRHHPNLYGPPVKPLPAPPLPDLSLLTPGSTNHSRSTSSDHQQQQQGPRKVRRCWSPELHRRFLAALQQLGGSQATPKQIRELMKVDGLTNDEVKSHLQKYRLHTRRTLSSSPAPATEERLWPAKPTTAASNSQSGSPQGPLQLLSGSGTAANDSSCNEEDRRSESYSWKGGGGGGC